MFRLLLVILLVTPLVELWVLIRVGQLIGSWPTVALVLITGVVGAWMARREGLNTLRLVRLQLSRGEMPAFALLDGVCILTGGVLLIAPGLVTDLIGFLLLLPQSRSVFKAWLKKRLEKWLHEGRFIILRRF